MNREIDKAAKALLKMAAPPKTPRPPSKPTKRDANRKFRLTMQSGKPKIEEMPE